MQTIEIFKVEKTGDDYLLLRNDSGAVRIKLRTVTRALKRKMHPSFAVSWESRRRYR
jgi:hypothetical protein